MSEDFEIEGFPLTYSEDAAILMHRDSHFAGSFDTMLEYYRSGGVGVVEDFSIGRIEELAAFERLRGENLAPIVLTGVDAEKIARARQLYLDLRNLYESTHPKIPTPRLIADLILSEEVEAFTEVKALVALGDAAIPALIDLLGSEDFYDPLFPGYGLAPSYALNCLQLIGDKRAIVALFERIGQSDFFDEEKVFTALKAIGEPAKQFLLRIVKSRPITHDNERAAMALVAFKNDAEIAKLCLEQFVQLTDWRSQLFFSTYLVLVCEGLIQENDRRAFRDMVQHKDLPRELKNDMQIIIRSWEKL